MTQKLTGLFLNKMFEKSSFCSLMLLLLLFTACDQQKESTSEELIITRVAFGSCANQDKEQPLLGVAARLQPDAFIFLGDNIYGDSHTMDTLKAKYARLGAKPEFQHLVNQTQVYAVWDDHDYGENDAGRHYPFKAESKAIFMDFWQVPASSDRYQHDGIYGVEVLKTAGHTVQIILLDTRTFRDNLIKRTPEDSLYKNDYIPNESPDSTILGAEQWAWLEQQFKTAADVRIIASSNQFSHTYNGWESWTNVPHERQRMLELIKKTQANGVVFISGDVHWGEISRLETEAGYPIYDVTSSGITETWDIIEPNEHRIGQAVPQNNVGLIEIKSVKDTTSLTLSLFDRTEEAVVNHKINLSEIRF